MAHDLLDGVIVADLAGEPAAMTGRMLADLGASVRLWEPDDGHPLRAEPDRWKAWTRGKDVLTGWSPSAMAEGADVVITTPGFAGAPALEARSDCVWVAVTPFGLDGPQAGWSATDLGVMAASGNMWATGDPDRPPVRCSEPAGYAHAAAEAVVATLTALASGRPQVVDVSMHEAIVIADMGAPGRFLRSGDRGQRRGANIGRTREIWPCRDGWISFGLRGGKARVPTLKALAELTGDAGLRERDWTEFSHVKASDEELAAIAEPIGEWLAGMTMADVYDLACERNLMLAPINSPKEIYASVQLSSRDFFADDGVPRSFFTIHHPRSGSGGLTRASNLRSRNDVGAGTMAWAGTRVVEFGSGAAGPIAVRYFAEHGATVVRVESRSRPDFLRVYAIGPNNPHGLEGSDLFDMLNAGKYGVSLNLKHPDGIGVARRLIEWADGVAENFAPRAMRGFGLDYGSLAQEIPGLLMVSTCLNGQTGPHRDYPGFGSQGAALSGFNWMTGWPDREPVGPFGTITDSLSPRFAASALAAGLLHKRRTGEGAHLDLSQVECGIYALTPWLLRHHDDGVVDERRGNRSPLACPHGVFPAAGDDRWVAIACWTDAEWASVAACIGVDEPGLTSLDGRLARIDEVEALVGAWTSQHFAHAVASELQRVGVEAVPVADFGDVHGDAQLRHRGHFQRMTHPFMGEGDYERNGFRLAACESGYSGPAPTIGEHAEFVLGDILGMTQSEIASLSASGALD